MTALLKPLGLVRHADYPNGVGYGRDRRTAAALDRQSARQEGGQRRQRHHRRPARRPTAPAVDAAHKAGMSAGGKDEGAPGLRTHYHPNYYGAYLRDPDGNKICIVCHKPRGVGEAA